MKKINLTPNDYETLCQKVSFYFSINRELINDSLSGNKKITTLKNQSTAKTANEAADKYFDANHGTLIEFNALRSWIELSSSEEEIKEALSFTIVCDDKFNSLKVLGIRKYAEILFISK